MSYTYSSLFSLPMGSIWKSSLPFRLSSSDTTPLLEATHTVLVSKAGPR